MSEESTTPKHPFDHIALSLSGGGVRAVGYHLGTLDYLNRAGLLKQVHTLSSVSGGSLVAIGYALSQKTGERFDDFYDNFCEFLPAMNTFEELLKVLREPTPPVASGSRSLITALARVYREAYLERYYGDPEFGIFWEDSPEIPLKEIIFNATEFKSGIAFRFQKTQHQSFIGNGMIYVDESHAKRIRMSDIMAASSCIPGGMEPMMFPQDFHWPGDQWRSRDRSERPFCQSVEQFMLDRFGTRTVPLMDGGVYDNQGITSIILSVARSFRATQTPDNQTIYDQQAALEPMRPHQWARWLLDSMDQGSEPEAGRDLGNVDLFIVSDTPVRRDPMYEATLSQGETRWFTRWLRGVTIGALDKFGWALMILLGLSLVATFELDVVRNLANPVIASGGGDGVLDLLQAVFQTTMVYIYGISKFGIPLFLILLTFASSIALRYYGGLLARTIAQELPPMGRSVWSYAKKLRLGQIWDMTVLRATSMSALTARIFMNRIRQLGFSLLYSHPEFDRRVMDNNINDIKTMTIERTSDVPDFLLSPSYGIEAVVERASAMNTKLWIDKPSDDRNDLDVLIAAGQVSTCFNTIEYLWQHHRDADGELNPEVRELFDFARADWMSFNDNPYWLVDAHKSNDRHSQKSFWHIDEKKKRSNSGRTKEKPAS